MAACINMYFFTLSHGSLLSFLGSVFLKIIFRLISCKKFPQNGKGMKKMS